MASALSALPVDQVWLSGYEQEMIERGEDLDADVLQLGHHGSRTSTSDAFLETVSPSTAIHRLPAETPEGAAVRLIRDGGTLEIVVDSERTASRRHRIQDKMAELRARKRCR